MVLRWREATLGEFTKQDDVYFVKTHSVVGDVVDEVLHKDSNVSFSRHATTRGRVIGYSVRILKSSVRVQAADTHIMVFVGNKPNAHKFHRVLLEDPLFHAASFKAGTRRDYMFVSRVREENDESDEAEETE